MSFSGFSRSTKRSIDLGGNSKKITRRELLEQARQKREARARQRQLETSAVLVQARVRSQQSRRAVQARHQLVWDNKVRDIERLQGLLHTEITLPLHECLALMREFNFFFQPTASDGAGARRALQVCAHVVKSLRGDPDQSLAVAGFHAAAAASSAGSGSDSSRSPSLGWVRRHRFQLLQLLSHVFGLVISTLAPSPLGASFKRATGGTSAAPPAAASASDKEVDQLLAFADAILSARACSADDAEGAGAGDRSTDLFNLDTVRYLLSGSTVRHGPSLPKVFGAFAQLVLPAGSAGARQRDRVLALVSGVCGEYAATCPPASQLQGDAAGLAAHTQACAEILRHVISSSVRESSALTMAMFASKHMWRDCLLSQLNSTAQLQQFPQLQRLFLLRNLLSVLASVVVERSAALRKANAQAASLPAVPGSPALPPARHAAQPCGVLADANLAPKWNSVLRLVQVLIQSLPSDALLGPEAASAQSGDLSSDDDDDDGGGAAPHELEFSGRNRFIRYMLRQVNHNFADLRAPQHAPRSALKSTDDSFWTDRIRAAGRTPVLSEHALRQLGVFGSRRFVETATHFLDAGQRRRGPGLPPPASRDLFVLGQIYAELLVRTVCRSHDTALQFLWASSSATTAEPRAGSGGAARDGGGARSTGQQFKVQLLTALTWRGAAEPLFVRIWRHVRSQYDPGALVEVLSASMRTGVAVPPPAASISPSSSSSSSSSSALLSAGDQAVTHDTNRAVVGCSFLTFVTYLYALESCNDHEFHVAERPLQLREVKDIIVVLRDLLFDLLWRQAPVTSLGWMQKLMAAVSCSLFTQLYSRDSRRNFVERRVWDWPPLPGSEVNSTTLSAGGSSRAALVLATLPQVIPFELRAAMYSAQVDAMWQHNQAFAGFGGHPGIQVTVRRDFIYEDAMAAFRAQFQHLQTTSQIAALLKQRVRVHFIDTHGRAEMGVDGGGLFKEFVDVLNRRVFDPEYGFWSTTPGHQMYPSPEADLVEPGAYLEHFTFMGQMLGLAMFNKISVEPIFANFFLKQLLGQRSEMNDLHSMDPELFGQLMALSEASSDELEEVDQKFEVQRVRLGGTESIPLVPGGSNIAVTADNLQLYVVQLANFKLNTEFALQTRAFLRGLRMLIPERLLKVFSPQELQTLISGSDKPLDVDDLRRHSAITNNHGFRPERQEEFMQWFWELLATLDVAQQQDFLRFVTSCPRPPLLGFASLSPRFGIQLMGAEDNTKLPMAGTCYNLLKLPVYSTPALLRQKLLLAISAKAGFEMS